MCVASAAVVDTQTNDRMMLMHKKGKCAATTTAPLPPTVAQEFTELCSTLQQRDQRNEMNIWHHHHHQQRRHRYVDDDNGDDDEEQNILEDVDDAVSHIPHRHTHSFTHIITHTQHTYISAPNSIIPLFSSRCANIIIENNTNTNTIYIHVSIWNTVY